MVFMNWKMGRWIAIFVALISGGLLTGIIPSVLGITLDYKLFGFDLSMLVGIGNFVVAWILYKIL